MSNFSDEFVALKCSVCGGKVELNKAKVESEFIPLENGGFVYIGVNPAEDGATCQHCGTQFVRKSTIQPYSKSGGGDITVGDVSGVGISIGHGARSTVILNTSSGARN